MPEEKTDHDRIVEMHTILLGANGTPGLCKQVKDNTKAIFRLCLAYVFIIASIGGSSYGVVKLLGD